MGIPFIAGTGLGAFVGGLLFTHVLAPKTHLLKMLLYATIDGAIGLVVASAIVMLT